MRTAYLIVGPESCGNRLWGRILIAAGCYGDGQVRQRLSIELVSNVNLPDRIVFIRSFPHGAKNDCRHWPSLPRLIDILHLAGYEDVCILVTYRDPYCAVKSQVAAGHVESEAEAVSNIGMAYKLIYDSLGGDFPMPVAVFPVSYELLVELGIHYANLILEKVGLGQLEELPEEIKDENAKYRQVEYAEPLNT